ncbi:MAG: flagellar hook-length control protein FliK [Deltaproteobacteria bacterium]|nr:flagellar hook-length control protein FliK [Deltaproteobacteria bacterium]
MTRQVPAPKVTRKSAVGKTGRPKQARKKRAPDEPGFAAALSAMVFAQKTSGPAGAKAAAPAEKAAGGKVPLPGSGGKVPLQGAGGKVAHPGEGAPQQVQREESRKGKIHAPRLPDRGTQELPGLPAEGRGREGQAEAAPSSREGGAPQIPLKKGAPAAVQEKAAPAAAPAKKEKASKIHGIETDASPAQGLKREIPAAQEIAAAPAPRVEAVPDAPKKTSPRAQPAGQAAEPAGARKEPVPVQAPPKSGESADLSPRARPKNPAFAESLSPAPPWGGAGKAPHAAPAGMRPETPAPQAPPDFKHLSEQVAVRISPLADGPHKVEIHLSPEHLGRLKIDLRIQAGQMDARLSADTPEARAILLRDEPALREALLANGITLSSYTVTLAGDSGRESRGGFTMERGEEGKAGRKHREETAIPAAAPATERTPGAAPGATAHWIA